MSLLVAFIGLSSFLYKTTEVTPEQKSLLWKIEGNGLKKPSYLFGTMHLIEKDYFYFPKSLEKLITKSDAVVLEIADITDKTEAMKYLMLKEGTVFDFFTKSQQDSLLAWVKEKSGLTEEMFRASFSKMKPFAILQTVSQFQFMGNTESYEMTITDIAKSKGVQLLGFETIAEQMGIFDNLTKEQQAEMVMAGVRGDDGVEETKKMQDLYRRQQLDSLYLMVSGNGGVFKEEEAAFLKNRNHNWIPKIKEFSQNKGLFIAVGAAHLAGPEGVIELLKKEGYTVIPVKF